MKVKSKPAHPEQPFVLPRIEGVTAKRIKSLSAQTSVSENRLANMACQCGIAAVEKRFNVKQTLAAILLLLATSASAADWAGFVRAIHSVETGQRVGPILGDGGKSLGPLQVSRAAWQDSRVGGRYEDVADLAVATRVLRAYLQRYAPRALSAEDWFTCSRIWNGGPKGASKSATLGYWRKVEAKL